MGYEELIRLAMQARQAAYAPYSGFWVGAALQADDGRIFTGCNVESCAFSPGSCAERTALVKAVSEGARRFSAIAIVGGRPGAPLEFCPPCGVCRQMLREFDGGEMQIVLAKSQAAYKVFSLRQLLPESFGPDQLACQEGETHADL